MGPPADRPLVSDQRGEADTPLTTTFPVLAANFQFPISGRWRIRPRIKNTMPRASTNHSGLCPGAVEILTLP